MMYSEKKIIETVFNYVNINNKMFTFDNFSTYSFGVTLKSTKKIT